MNLDDNTLENARSSPNIPNNPKIVIPENRESGHFVGFKKVEIKNRSVEQNNMDRVRRNLFRDGTNKVSQNNFIPSMTYHVWYYNYKTYIILAALAFVV